MSFLKKLFGGRNQKDGDSQQQPIIDGAEIEYSGFIIRATPFKEAGQYQSCGVILKEIDGTLREYRFIRADRFTMIHIKARQIIDEQGNTLFSSLSSA